MSIASRIKNRRKYLNMTADDVAQIIGKDRATVYRYESKAIIDMPITVLEPLARALKTTPAYLMGVVDDPDWRLETNETTTSTTNNEPTPTNAVEYKEVDSLQIGKDSKVTNAVYTGKKVSVQKSDLEGRRPEDCFVLRIKNDVNAPRLLPDDEVLCCRCDKVENGEIAVVYYHGEEASIKQVYYNNDGTIELVPANPAYRSQFIDGERLKTFHILGKIIMLIRKKF